MRNLRDDNILLLPDGRRLGYAECGDPKGKPIFEFHGNPSSRLGSILFDEAARRLDIRVIGIDRPGMGLSDFKPNRKLLDWPDDVIELANALGIDRFPIVGGSGGVPSTLACAYKIPERLTSVGVLFGPRPLGAPGATAGWSRSRRIQVFLGRNGPIWIGSLAMKAVARVMRRNPDRALSKMFKELPEPDKKAFNQPGVKQQYLDTIQEAFRSGTRGVALDYALNMKPWGFRLEDIQIEVYLWHGEDDTVVPPAMGRYLAQAIPNCQARFIPGEGHFSLLPNYVEEILNTLVSSNGSSR
ncbi:MAG: alpha/beta hydrolase [Phycisphaerae bacterium]|nr:alpha/beta hydrolase [Phycisphaerae bacterium]